MILCRTWSSQTVTRIQPRKELHWPLSVSLTYCPEPSHLTEGPALILDISGPSPGSCLLLLVKICNAGLSLRRANFLQYRNSWQPQEPAFLCCPDWLFCPSSSCKKEWLLLPAASCMLTLLLAHHCNPVVIVCLIYCGSSLGAAGCWDLLNCGLWPCIHFMLCRKSH